MEFSWDEKTIRWFENASAYTGFHKKLAELIRPKLKGFDSLGDLGCGLGKLDLELASDIKNITCLDISLPALENLRERVAEGGLSNITAKMQDCSELDGQWDVLLMSYFGNSELAMYLEHCGKLILIMDNTGSNHSLYPEKYKRYRRKNAEDIKLFLEKSAISYQCTAVDLEFGQPFSSFEDAQEFVAVYTGCEKDELKSFLKENMIPLQHDMYRWYLPHKKSLAVFEIEGGGKAG